MHDLLLPAAESPAPTPASPTESGGMAVARVELPVALPVPATPVTGGVAARLEPEAEVWQALVLALRDYVRKNRFGSVVLGLSGGIDSSVVAAIAVDALGPHRVVGVSMPSQHSSDHSRQDAAELASAPGWTFAPNRSSRWWTRSSPTCRCPGSRENLQARVRGVILMALSNQEGHLVLTNSNKSELAVGYSTLYGDSVGGFNPLKDVPKTWVWRLARWRNRAAEEAGQLPPIPQRSITKPPSAELRPGQQDTDSLPAYEELDALLADYIDRDLVGTAGGRGPRSGNGGPGTADGGSG